MKILKSLILPFAIFIIGCRHCDILVPSVNNNSNGPCDSNYYKYSNDTLNFVKKDIPNPHFENNYESIPGTKYGYSDAKFNPENPYEISFITTRNGKVGIYKYNFCTNKLNLIIDKDKYYYDYNWCVNDWILFTSYDQNLWKVKSNGDSLICLNHTGSKANLSPDGKLVSYKVSSKLVLSDINGNNVDNTNLYVEYYSWLNDSEIVYTTFQGVHHYNIHTKVQFDYSVNLSETLNPFYLNSNTKQFYFYNYAVMNPNSDTYLQCLNLNSNSIDTVTRIFDTQLYTQGDYAPQTNKCIVDITIRNWKNDDVYTNILVGRTFLQIGDGDFTNLREVDLPE